MICVSSWISLPSSHPAFLPFWAAGTQAGEEIPIVSRNNIKEFKDSFSNEKFDFRSNANITFYVYVSNFTWPVKIQVRGTHTLLVCVWSARKHRQRSLCFVLRAYLLLPFVNSQRPCPFIFFLINLWPFLSGLEMILQSFPFPPSSLLLFSPLLLFSFPPPLFLLLWKVISLTLLCSVAETQSLCLIVRPVF